MRFGVEDVGLGHLESDLACRETGFWQTAKGPPGHPWPECKSKTTQISMLNFGESFHAWFAVAPMSPQRLASGNSIASSATLVGLIPFTHPSQARYSPLPMCGWPASNPFEAQQLTDCVIHGVAEEWLYAVNAAYDVWRRM